MIGNKQTVHMKNRQGMQQGVFPGELPYACERTGIGNQVAVRHHRTLAAPGRPRGVDNDCEVIAALCASRKFRSRSVCNTCEAVGTGFLQGHDLGID